MATPLSASQLVRALEREGCRVREVRSWRTHNRNHKGAWGPINGVMIHHTVTSGSARTVDICYDGYSGLPGPLCHGVITKDGTVHLVGNGRANHAGLGDDDVLRAVIAERTSLPAANERNTDGNARFYGFECENLGDGDDPWPDVQLDAIERASAAICRAYGWAAESVIGHKEWSYTKIDPRGFSMEGMRRRINERLDGSPEEDDMPGFSGLGATKDLTLTRGHWRVIPWDEEWQDQASDHPRGGKTFVKGPASFTGTASLRFDNLPTDAQVQARIVEWADDRPVHDHPIGEGSATGGDTFLAFPFTNRIRDKGRRAALEVVYHGGPDTLVLRDSYLKLLIWEG